MLQDLRLPQEDRKLTYTNQKIAMEEIYVLEKDKVAMEEILVSKAASENESKVEKVFDYLS